MLAKHSSNSCPTGAWWRSTALNAPKMMSPGLWFCPHTSSTHSNTHTHTPCGINTLNHYFSRCARSCQLFCPCKTECSSYLGLCYDIHSNFLRKFRALHFLSSQCRLDMVSEQFHSLIVCTVRLGALWNKQSRKELSPMAFIWSGQISTVFDECWVGHHTPSGSVPLLLFITNKVFTGGLRAML